MMDNSFPKRHRLRSSPEFARVFDAGVFAANQHLVLQAAFNGLKETRIGLSVSRKVGNAVTRNRWKRLIRESFRLQKNLIPSGMDLVIRPRKGARPNFCQIRSSLVFLAGIAYKKLERDSKKSRS